MFSTCVLLDWKSLAKKALASIALFLLVAELLELSFCIDCLVVSKT